MRIKEKNMYAVLCACLLGSYLLFVASTCEKPVDIQIDEPLQLVAVCEFSPQKPFRVFVSESKSILDRADKETVYKEDAVVQLIEGNNPPQLIRLKDNISGAEPYYESDFLPKANQTYILRVDANNFPSIQATDQIPDAVPFESILKNIEVEHIADNTYAYTLDLEFQWEDKANIENYYHLNIYRPISFFWLEDGDTITNIVNPLGAEFLSESLNPDGLFNINFNGGALVQDIAFDGQEVNLPMKFQFQINASEELFEFLYIELRSVSKTYYQFNTGVSLQHQEGRSTPLSDPVVIPSNIEDGLGVFAGFNATRDTLKRK